MKKVFIIDDDEMYQMVLSKIIKKIDPEIVVETFWNGEKALEYFNINKNNPLPKLLLLDINMPIMDGWQFISEFESRYPNLKTLSNIYMFSSSLEERERTKALSFKSVKDYLLKPVSINLMRELIAANIV